MATAKQEKNIYAVIHILRKEIWGEDRADYERMLKQFYGAGSSTDLSYRGKLDFIDRLKAVRDGRPQPEMDRHRGMWASIWQVNKINALEEVLGWSADPQRLNGFIRRQTSKNKTKWMLTDPEATKVIIGLQRIISGGNRELYNWLNTAIPSLILTPYGRKKIRQLKSKASS